MNCDAEKFYTDNIRLLNSTIKILKYLPALKKLWEKYLVFRSGMKILDVGCGTGALTKTLLEVSEAQGIDDVRFFSFDITKKVLDEFQNWIKQKEVTSVRTARADLRRMAEELPAHWQNFDFICSSGVLEYLEEKELVLALKNFRSYLSDGGTLITFGSRSHILNFFLIKCLYKANLYGKKKFAELLHQAGYSKIDYWKFPSPYSYLNLWGYIIVAKK